MKQRKRSSRDADRSRSPVGIAAFKMKKKNLLLLRETPQGAPTSIARFPQKPTRPPRIVSKNNHSPVRESKQRERRHAPIANFLGGKGGEEVLPASGFLSSAKGCTLGAPPHPAHLLARSFPRGDVFISSGQGTRRVNVSVREVASSGAPILEEETCRYPSMAAVSWRGPGGTRGTVSWNP